MSYQNCVDVIQNAAGRELDNDELDAMLTALQAREKYLLAKGIVTDQREAALQAASELANNVEMSAVIEQRNAAMNMVKRMEKVSWVISNFGKNYAEGLEAILVGVNRAKTGARNSVMASQKSLRDSYLAGLAADLDATGHLNIFNTGVLDRDISRALWAIGKDNEQMQLGKLPKEAVDLAKVIRKWQEVARMDANEAGAWIREAKGYIVKQSHDQERIQKAGLAQWVQDAAKFFDLDRMGLEMGGASPSEILSSLYSDFASGKHMKAIPDDELAGMTGPSNVAKKMSQSREVYFKDADAWFDYNELYGSSNLREAVVGGLRHRAEATGIMRNLGTNPEAMLTTITNDLDQFAKSNGDVDNRNKLSNSQNMRDKYLSAVDGSMNIAGSALWARRSSNIRAVETMAKLGGMILSQMNDIAIFASEMRYQGKSFLSGMGEAVSGLGRNLSTPEQRQLLSSLDVVLESMIGELGNAAAMQDPGAASKSLRLFMKLNLSQWWSEKFKASAALGMSHLMALNSDHAWGSLSDDYRRALDLYGIDKSDWELIRQSKQKHVDGRSYITPELIHDLPDDAFGLSGAKLAERKSDIERKLRTYFSDRGTFAMLEPDQKTRALMLQATKAGTVEGEMFRFMTQFKSFTGAYMQKIMGRELYGRGYEGDAGFAGIFKALANGNGEMLGLVNIILWSTLAGYGSMTLKDMLKGRSPRDPMDIKTWQAALLQGGGAGIYGDFLFGKANRFGSGLADTAVGPVASSAFEFIDLYHKAINGDDLASSALKTAINNTPYVNLFYTRIALDYLIIYRMQEAMNPGYLRRMERRVQNENAQTFLLRPSEVIH